MTIKELQIIIDRAKKEADEFYDRELKKEEIRANNKYRKELDKIRNDVYELNKEVGFYDIAGIEYEEFLEVMKEYSYVERMKIAYALLQHIALLDNIVFDKEGEA